MKTRTTILNRILILALAFSVLNLFEGCMAYDMARKNEGSKKLYEKYIRQEKYFILVTPKGMCHLSGPRITGSDLCATIAPVDGEYLPYLYQDSVTASIRDIKHRNRIVDKQVFIYTSMPVPGSSEQVVIPLSSIEKVSIYKWRLTNATKGAILIALLLGILLVATGGDVGYVIGLILEMI